MIKSMTGFATITELTEKGMLKIEIKSFNHRFLDIYLSLSPQLEHLDRDIKDHIKKRILRGKLVLSIGLEIPGEGTRSYLERARDSYKALLKIKEDLNIPGEITMDHLLTFQGIFRSPEKEVFPLWSMEELAPLFTKAMDMFDRSRKEEGDTIFKDILYRVDKIDDILSEIKEGAKKGIDNLEEKTKKKMQLLSLDNSLDESRFYQELTYFLIKNDITEEMVRSESHLAAFKKTAGEDEPVGKKLEFILQELAREINTMGAKITGDNLSLKVVEVKSELEKIREQIRNVE
ncbi:MAG: YicC/YloC family endoribonuclease [bacterium]|nr:YicC/YloC family endoribonuclease [bacterium]